MFNNKAGNACAMPVLGYLKHFLLKRARRVAFTMAEILLSLTIIGVVAAITLPSLTGNINERTWNTQRKALYSRMSQALALMPQIKGYGDLSLDYVAMGNLGTGSTVYSSDKATELFITNGLAKVLKLNNICDKDHLSDCGLPEQIARLDAGEKISLSSLKMLSDLHSNFKIFGINCSLIVQTSAAAFETANGESILVHYKPLCMDKDSTPVEYYREVIRDVCANFIYDLNGKKGPNMVGKDIGFMTLFYPTNSVLVAPFPHSKDLSGTYTHSAATQACQNHEDSRLPTVDEFASIAVNSQFISNDFFESEAYWTASKLQASPTYYLYAYQPGNTPSFSYAGNSAKYRVRCVKR